MTNTAFITTFVVSANDYALRGNLDEREVGLLLGRLLPRIVQSFNIDFSKKSSTIYHHQYSQASDHRYEVMDPSILVKFLQLADISHVDSTEVLNKLTKYVETMEVNAMEDAFPKLLLPLANGICEHTEKMNGLSTDAQRRLVTKILTSYVINYVRNPSQPSPDIEARTTIRCSCADCSLLRIFISDESKKVEQFAMSEKRRRHLEMQLDKSCFSTNTIRQGSPHRLVVEKKQILLESNHLTWITRVRAAKAELDKLAQYTCLKEQILGDDGYHSIFEHENLKIPANAPPPATLGLGVLTSGNNHNTIRSTVPQKRTSEM